MAYIASQIGPYAFFAVNRANGTGVAINSGIYVKDTETTGKKPKSIYVADGGTLPKLVKHVWVNDAGTLKLVSPLQTVVMDLNNGVSAIVGDNSGTRQTNDYRFTMNGSNAYLPANWTGQISFWVGGSGLTPNMTTPPTNNVGGTLGYFGVIESTSGADSMAYQLLGGVAGVALEQGYVMTALNFNTDPTGPLTHPPPINGIMSNYPAHVGMTIVNSPHVTTYINDDGTPFSFNKYHSYTALAKPWSGIRINWDGERSNSDQLRFQQHRTLRMAVTSTSNIVPTYG